MFFTLSSDTPYFPKVYVVIFGEDDDKMFLNIHLVHETQYTHG